MKQQWTHFQEILDEKRCEKTPTCLESAIPLDETHLFYDNQKILNFCTHDYLGLSYHSELQKNAIKFTLQHGHSSSNTAMNLQRGLEVKLAQCLGIDATRIVPSRYLAHTAILPTLAHSQSLILIDSSAHFSLKQAATSSRARMEIFKHNDMSHLKALLEETNELAFFSKVVVTESIFNTEGDRAPLEELTELAHYYDGLLYVDETHALGALGKRGMGLTAHKREIDVRIGAFDCGCGASLAFVGGSALCIDFLQTFCPALKENPLPLPALGVIDAIIDLLPDLEGERKVLAQRAYHLTTKLKKLGYDTGTTSSHIIPIILKENERVLATYETLLEEKIITKPLCVPDVGSRQARVLLTLSIHHTPEHISELLNSLEKVAQELACAT